MHDTIKFPVLPMQEAQSQEEMELPFFFSLGAGTDPCVCDGEKRQELSSIAVREHRFATDKPRFEKSVWLKGTREQQQRQNDAAPHPEQCKLAGCRTYYSHVIYTFCHRVAAT